MGRTPRVSKLAPRKTPQQERAERTVDTLIEAAAQVLETHGLEGYNTNAVALRAGISIGSLYQYFRNKDALTVALMRREEAAFRQDVVDSFEDPGGRVAMTRFIEAAVRQQLARPRLARLLDIEESRPEVQKAMKDSTSLRRRLADVLDRADMPRQPDALVAALDVGAMIRGLTDGAGERGETDRAALHRRIDAAVFGYLERMATPTSTRKASTRSVVPLAAEQAVVETGRKPGPTRSSKAS